MTDTVFEKIRFRNFMAFGQQWTEVDLSQPGTTFIIGENLDEGGSSGAGKSTLINAMSFCLFDKVDDISSKDGVINTTNAKKNTSMEVELFFTKDGHSYRVHRFRGDKTGVQLWEDDKDITPASVNRGQDSFNSKVEDLVGFSYKLFSKIIIFNGNARPFLSLAVGEQRILIEELFKITMLSRKANACKRLVSDTDKQIELQKLLIKQQEAQNETHRRHVTEARQRVERWDAQHVVDLQKVADDIQQLSEFDFDTEEALHGQLSQLAEELRQILVDKNQLTTQCTAAEMQSFPKAVEFGSLSNSVDKKLSETIKLRSEVKHLVDEKCPYCLQKFSGARNKIGELESKITELEDQTAQQTQTLELLIEEDKQFVLKKSTDVQNFKSKIATKRSQELELTNTINEIKSTLTYKTPVDLARAKTAMGMLQSKLIEVSGAVNPHLDAYKALESEGEIKIDRQALEDLVKLQAHQEFLVKLLMDKNSFIRKGIVSKTVPFLNKRIGYYTERLNLPHVVLFQPDMTCQISQLGREIDHGMLSAGEKKRLNLSLCLAFRDVLTFLHSKVNVLFTDEVDGGSLCEMNVNSMVQLFKQKAWDDGITIFCISHSPYFEGRLDRTWTVRKEQGFSTIITQPE